jgi:crotonobetainyl-CoA:carnitine CoA-transferase CaiB-like acyl-CoA transferase
MGHRVVWSATEALPGLAPGAKTDILGRGRRSVIIDLKRPEGTPVALRLIERADALVEGFRPGVMERLGLGPDECLARNPKLVYGRMTGWGQIVDAAMVDGAALPPQMNYGLQADGLWGERGTNLLDTGAWFYEVYETADGEHISLGPIEHQFLARMLEITGLAAEVDGRGPIPGQQDQSTWPDMKDRVAALIKTRPRDAWSKILEASDACFAPVLSVEEAAAHPHNVAGGEPSPRSTG